MNLSTVFTLCRDVGAYMLTRSGPHRGSIVNIASLVSFQGGLTVPAYASAKGGVAQLTKALSNEWASKGINVNAVSLVICNGVGDWVRKLMSGREDGRLRRAMSRRI